MRRLRFAVLAAAALPFAIASPWALHAQFPAEVTVGARVRAWVPEPHRQVDGPARRQLLRGTVQAVASDTLHLSIPGAVTGLLFPHEQWRRVRLRR